MSRGINLELKATRAVYKDYGRPRVVTRIKEGLVIPIKKT